MSLKAAFILVCLGTSIISIGPASAARSPKSQQPSTPVAHQDATNDLSVVVGRSIILDCASPIQRVSLGLGGVAEATVITHTEILLNGKAAGETSLILWEKGGNREFFNVTVRPSQAGSDDRLDSLRRELKKELPGQTLKISSENGSIFLSGTVHDLESSARAERIAAVDGKVVNLLNVEVPLAEPQILLKVVFASVDRSRSKQLGLNLFSNGFGNVLAGINTGQFSPPSLGLSSAATSLSSDLTIFAFLPGLNLGATIEAMESKGLVQVLAQPNVLAENGKQGSFLAGGEYPYPVVQGSAGGSSSVSIMFKEYGVRLNFIPTIQPNGNIRLQVAPEVSSLDFSNAIEVSGFQVPAIAVRRVKTEIELSQGQSFAIGGLLDNRENETFQKIPFLSSIPILGKFFQSVSKTKTNSELIVIVTPEIVQPVTGAISPPKFPAAFMDPNSKVPMHTPDDKSGAPPAPITVSVDKLIDSMKPEKPLIIDGTMSPGSSGSSGP